MKDKTIIASLGIMILLLIAIQTVSAINDPGHDTLYVEQQGDSELNGTLNITNNLSLTSTSKVKQGGVLTLYADGSTPGGTETYISATGSTNYDLYIETQGSIYFKSLTTGMMYIGKTGTPTSLNISGALYLNGSNNKLDTGPAGSASNLSLYWGDKLLCNASQTNCGWTANGTTISGGGNGWTNTSTTVSLVNTANNVSANTLFIDNTNGKVGIGDTSPDTLLDIQSSSVANQLRVSYDDSNYGNISVNSGGNMTIRATGHVIIDIS